MKSIPFKFGAGGLLMAAMPAGAQARPVHNIVLVHGAFANAASWDKVATILRAKGFSVTEVDNPLTSLDDDIAATRAALAAQTGPAILVGHSWGGVVIGEAGNDPKVKALVYIAAFAPDLGESVQALSSNGPPTEGLKAVRPAVHLGANGFLKLDPAAFPHVFASDAPPAEAARMAETQIPISAAAFGAKATVAAWHSKPTYYAISGNDLMLPPQAEGFFAQRMKATTVTIASSHASPVAHPDAVATLIERAAREN